MKRLCPKCREAPRSLFKPLCFNCWDELLHRIGTYPSLRGIEMALLNTRRGRGYLNASFSFPVFHHSSKVNS